jgi:class 3 adenylate cyclase/tetratricopeptide (TPR) repeat protein
MTIEITDWLRKLGLEQYAPAFRDNAIDSKVLPRLTAEDLRDLGVTMVGHRRRLLDAIAALSDEAPAAVVEPTSRDASESTDAERRQVTVMFCDLVGSTALSTRFDPEDLQEVIGAYQGAVTEATIGFGGFVAKYMGDGVLVYFGYPRAHEDDAERAVRAGLRTIEAVGRLGPVKLEARIGIASGSVVVGDLIGKGSSQEQSIIGETPNLAARLQMLAPPGALVIAASTRQQIGELFDLEHLGWKQLAGFGEPQLAWRVLGESPEVGRFAALRSGRSPLIGRDEEVELLMRRWKQAKSGEGRVVLISGEPGIGKSRLTVALSECIGNEPHTRLRHFCSPHYQDSALHPFIVQLERAAEFARDDTSDGKLGKLRALLAPGTRDEDFALLSELLSLPSSAADLNLGPRRKRETLLNAFLSQLEAESRRQPVLMVLEDAHWIDPTSRELLDLTVDRVRQLSVLLAITFRPEFQQPWGGRSHVTSLALSRLGERDGAALAKDLAGDVLNADVIAEIARRTDGVPLFVEELTKAVLESAGQANRGASVTAPTSLAAVSVPVTLQASLVARLDRLGPTPKAVAQIGAVLGREFGYELIEPVAQHDEGELRAALDQLSDAGLLFCRGTPPHSFYLFKHAMVQDAAYGMLLRSRRQELHGRVAAVLEKKFVDLVERQPELLAHHLTGAADTARAVDQWLKAGQYAAARLAHVEAIGHFERGLAALAALPQAQTRDRTEVELQLARGLSLFTAEGFSSAEAARAYARARELAEQLGNPRQQFIAVYGLWQSANGTGMIRECRRLSDRLLQLTARETDVGLRLQGHHSAWATCLFSGEPASAREHCDAGCQLYDPEQHRSHSLLYGGHDPGTCARFLGAMIYWLLGYPQQALTLSTEAVAMAERLAHPLSLEIALLYGAMLHLDRGEPELALRRLDAAETLVADERLGFIVEPHFLRGAALTAQGEFANAVASLREGLAGRLGMLRDRAYGLARLSEALVRRGEHEAALTAAREGLEVREKTGSRQWEPECQRLEGIALLSLNRLEDAEHALQEALRVARTQQAKAYELRAAMSLARLWGEQGRRTEARDLLAPVYGWFTEGFDTADLKVAKKLLGELK